MKVHNSEVIYSYNTSYTLHAWQWSAPRTHFSSLPLRSQCVSEAVNRAPPPNQHITTHAQAYSQSPTVRSQHANKISCQTETVGRQRHFDLPVIYSALSGLQNARDISFHDLQN